MQLHDFAGQIFVETLFRAIAAALGDHRIGADRCRLVEEEQHRGMLLDRQQQVAEAPHDVRPDRLELQQPGKSDRGLLGRRDREMIGPEMSEPLGKGGLRDKRAIDARADQGRIGRAAGLLGDHDFRRSGGFWHGRGGEHRRGGGHHRLLVAGKAALGLLEVEIVGQFDCNAAAVGDARDVGVEAVSWAAAHPRGSPPAAGSSPRAPRPKRLSAKLVEIMATPSEPAGSISRASLTASDWPARAARYLGG